jgi:hypothetical protein
MIPAYWPVWVVTDSFPIPSSSSVVQPQHRQCSQQHKSSLYKCSLSDELLLLCAGPELSVAYEYDCSNYWCPPGEECYMHYLYCFRGECKYTPRCKKKTTWSSRDSVQHVMCVGLKRVIGPHMLGVCQQRKEECAAIYCNSCKLIVAFEELMPWAHKTIERRCTLGFNTVRVNEIFCKFGKGKHLKNAVFWDVTPCGSSKNRCFGVT